MGSRLGDPRWAEVLGGGYDRTLLHFEGVLRRAQKHLDLAAEFLHRDNGVLGLSAEDALHGIALSLCQVLTTEGRRGL